MSTCYNCGNSSWEEYPYGNDYHMYKWKCIKSGKDEQVCNQCVLSGVIKPEFVNEDDQLWNPQPGMKVAVKTEEKWSLGYVWEFDRTRRVCKVEWELGCYGTTEVPYEDVKQILRINQFGRKVPIEYRYSTIKEFLVRQNHYLEFDVETSDIQIDVLNRVNKELDVLGAVPRRDFEPGSEEKVLNLIDPSLFCYVQGISALKRKNSNLPVNSQPKSVYRYQWLPTSFVIDANGTVKIDNYISGLGSRKEYPDLYQSIEEIFACFVPLLETCLTKLYRKNDQYSSLKDMLNSQQQISVKEGSLQVIVSAQNYILHPWYEYEGTWNLAGTAHEYIIATAVLYYNSSDNLDDEGLCFRRILSEFELAAIRDRYTYLNPLPFDYSTYFVELGNVKPKSHKCVVYPNTYQSKLGKLKNSGQMDIAKLKALYFYIVDPSKKIISTDDIMDQNWSKTKGMYEQELQGMVNNMLGCDLPKEVVEKVLKSAKVGFTLSEAKKHRESQKQER